MSPHPASHPRQTPRERRKLALPSCSAVYRHSAAPRCRQALLTQHPSLTVEVQIAADLTLVVGGEIDMATAAQLRNELLHGVAVAETTVFLDLGEVSFMDSSGVHALITTQRRATRLAKQVVLTRTSSSVERILEVTGTASMFR